LLGGVLLDRFGIAVLPWVAGAIIAAGFAFVLASDRARLAAHR
jgi:predicted MFS family arabinose efflux permease